MVDRHGELVAEASGPYPEAFADPAGWRAGLIALCRQLPQTIRASIGAIAIDGTSGTLLLCRPNGELATGDLGLALAYSHACPEHQAQAGAMAGEASPAASASGSLARALRLLDTAQHLGIPGQWLLRHQADWLMGWLLGDWRWGE